MWTMIWRTVLFHAILIVTVRLLGKRQIGEMEPSEFVVTMLLANLATIPMEEPDRSILHGIVPIGLVIAAEMLMALLMFRSIRVRRLLCGKPVILIENGRILEKNLRQTHVNLDELTMHLREQEIFDLSEVKFAILETNGQLSTLLYAKDRPASAKDAGIKATETELPVTLISDGNLMQDNLKIAKRDAAWVAEELQKRNCKLTEVLLMTLDSAGKVYFVKKRGKR